jgi:nitroreductase
MDSQALLALMQARRSRRTFSPRPLAREELEPLFEAARCAPSATNRQPWRYNVILDPRRKAALCGAVRDRVEALRALLAGSEYLGELQSYSDFFYEPLEAAPAVIVPQWRPFPDTVGALVSRAGHDPAPFSLAPRMPAELCGAAAATMSLLLMAEASGLACCWMAGPMLAREDFCRILDIPSPWTPLGAIAIGHPPEGAEPPAPPRKSQERIVEWNLP